MIDLRAPKRLETVVKSAIAASERSLVVPVYEECVASRFCLIYADKLHSLHSMAFPVSSPSSRGNAAGASSTHFRLDNEAEFLQMLFFNLIISLPRVISSIFQIPPQHSPEILHNTRA